MKQRASIAGLLVVGCVFGAARAAESGEQRIVVPLTDPGRPVQLDVDLFAGQIEVTGYDGREVVVVARSRGGPAERGSGEDGMKRIPNTALGLSVEEERNHVSVSGAWQGNTTGVYIQVPVRTVASLRTVNGGNIVVRGLQGELELHNTNGGIEATGIKGSVVADTTNGSVVVTFDQITPDKPMSFITLNGNVDVSFPAGLKAELRIEPGRGDILTDFDFELLPSAPRVERTEGKGSFRVEVGQDVRAKVGGGGPTMHLKTFNGRILIRRASTSR